MNRSCNVKTTGPIPRALRRGQEVTYHLISITKSILKIFYTKLCVCSHKLKIKNISDEIFILSPGLSPRIETWGCLGVLNIILSIRMLCYLLLDHWTKSNQI